MSKGQGYSRYLYTRSIRSGAGGQPRVPASTSKSSPNLANYEPSTLSHASMNSRTSLLGANIRLCKTTSLPLFPPLS